MHKLLRNKKSIMNEMNLGRKTKELRKRGKIMLFCRKWKEKIKQRLQGQNRISLGVSNRCSFKSRNQSMAKLLRSKDARNRRYSGTKMKNRETPSPCQSCRPRALLHHLARRGGRREKRAGGGRATRCSPPSPPLRGRGSRPRRHLHHGASCCSGLLSPPLVRQTRRACLVVPNPNQHSAACR
jgi:hypothetical protein